jgi:hypothetical protein
VRGVRLSNTWRLSRQLQTVALKDQQFRHLEVMLSLKSMGCSQTGEHTSPPPECAYRANVRTLIHRRRPRARAETATPPPSLATRFACRRSEP